MSFPLDSERPDLSTHAVRFSIRNALKAWWQLPFGGPFPTVGVYKKENEITPSGGGLKIVDRVAPDVKPGDKVVVFTQGARPDQ